MTTIPNPLTPRPAPVVLVACLVWSFAAAQAMQAQPAAIFAATFEIGDASEWSRSAPPPPSSLLSSDPMQGEADVALGREAILRFSDAIDPATVTSASIYAESAGVPLPGSLRVSEDRLRVTLFFTDPLPDQSSLQVFVEGDLLRGANGQPVDASGDRRPGGRWALGFTTQNLDVAADTRVCGRVLASAAAAGGHEVPLVDVTISVDGAEGQFSAQTDTMGNYCLDPAPARRFFVHIDGTTASNPVPAGTYYPSVGKAFEPIAGLTVHVGESYLPLIGAGTLQTVSEDDDTSILLPPAVVSERPELAGSELMVPAGSLYFDDGSPGREAGIAPVPSDRLPGQLPADLSFPVVLTVQTAGATNFDTPAPICFPNLPNPQTGAPLAPGAPQGLVSFDHDAGRWRAVGSMTVTADGSQICSDLGSGILAPGWHLPAEPPVASPALPNPLPATAPHPPHDVAPVTQEAPEAPMLPPEQAAACPEGLAGCRAKCTPTRGKCRTEKTKARKECAKLRAPKWHKFLRDAGCADGGIGGALVATNCEAQFQSCLRDCADRCSTNRRDLAEQDHPPGGMVEDPIFEQIFDLREQMFELVKPYIDVETDLPPGIISQLDALIAQENAIAGGDADAYVRDAARSHWRELQDALPPGNGPHYPILYLAELVREADDSEPIVLRGLTQAYGQYLIFPPNGSTLIRIRFYDPYTHSYGLEYPVLLEDGSYGVSRFYLHPIDDAAAPDSDGDLLVDLVESIYGSDPFRADTDGDGVDDRDEVRQGTDLLGADIDIGPVVTGTISEAGERDRFGFAALAGQRVFFDIQDGASLSQDWLVMDANGDTVFDRAFFSDAGTHELTRGGTYTLYLGNESSQTTGPYTFQLWNVPEPDAFSIAIGDLVADGIPGPGAGRIESPGRENLYRFDATAGQRLFADLLDGGSLSWDWRLEAPDGSAVFDRSLFGDAGTHLLPQTGQYVLRVGELSDDHIGTYSLRLVDVPAPDTFAVAIGDTISDGTPAAGAGHIESPAREDIYTFHANAGQSLLFDILAGGSLSWRWRLEAPDGTSIFDRSFFTDSGPHLLDQTGTYALRIGNPDSDVVGTYSFQILEP